jgi:hypothetical protein
MLWYLFDSTFLDTLSVVPSSSVNFVAELYYAESVIHFGFLVH